MDVRREMKVESAVEEKDKITVVTTGAKYVFDKSGGKGKIFCYQRINKERLVAEAEINYPFKNLSVEFRDESTCIMHERVAGCSHIRLEVNRDSMLDIHYLGHFLVSFDIKFKPEYRAWQDGRAMFIDEIGGIGIYPKDVVRTNFVGSKPDELKINYTLALTSARIMVSVFPPRRFQQERMAVENIAHYGVNPPYPTSSLPTDDMIEEVSKYANILVLHQQLWQGKTIRQGKIMKTEEDIIADHACSVYEYVPVNEKEMVRVIKKCHSMKMKVIPYMSIYYSLARKRDFLEKVKENLNKYEFDGIYSDGYAGGYSDEFINGYEMVKEVRRVLEDRIFYLHNTSDPFHNRYLYCPFINTYADYVLRGEFSGEFDEDYMKYGLSGYNTSNTINFVCHCFYAPEFVRSLIDKAIKYKMKFYLGLPMQKAEKVLKEEYFPKL